LVGARRTPPPLLEPVDGSLHDVPLAVDCPVEARVSRLVRPRRDHRRDPVRVQPPPSFGAAVAFIPDDGFGPPARPSRAAAPYRAANQQDLQHWQLVPFATRQRDGDGLAAPLGPQVELARESTPATTEGFRRRIAPF